MSGNASTDELYFVTLTVTDWIDVFTRRLYNDFLIENLKRCQQHKKLNTLAISFVQVQTLEQADFRYLGQVARLAGRVLL